MQGFCAPQRQVFAKVVAERLVPVARRGCCGSEGQALRQGAFRFRPLLQSALPRCTFIPIFDVCAHEANPRLIIPPADKCPGVYFAPTHGTPHVQGGVAGGGEFCPVVPP
jgi:hypothetical protein